MTISQWFWLLSYKLEEARQRYAGKRHLLRQAACYVALALMRMAGAR